MIYNDDCFNILPQIADKSVDMILCDLPFGKKSNNKWDIALPIKALWEQYIRVTKNHGAIVLHATQPFTSHLICSNLEWFKYTWVWNKVNRFSGHLNAKKQPLRITEDIVVFYKEQPTYNPQMVVGKPYKATSKGNKTDNYGKQKDGVTTINNGFYYPKNIININADERGTVGRIHPTQKPIKLAEYLIQTYTNENDLVLDNCMGSGTTIVAAKNLHRNYIGIEKDKEYFAVCQSRLEAN